MTGSAMRTRTIWFMAIADLLFLGLTVFAVIQIVRGENVGRAVVILLPGVLGMSVAGRGTLRAFSYDPDDQTE